MKPQVIPLKLVNGCVVRASDVVAIDGETTRAGTAPSSVSRRLVAHKAHSRGVPQLRTWRKTFLYLEFVQIDAFPAEGTMPAVSNFSNLFGFLIKL